MKKQLLHYAGCCRANVKAYIKDRDWGELIKSETAPEAGKP